MRTPEGPKYNQDDQIVSLERSIADCNEHYRGMLDIYTKGIQILREGGTFQKEEHAKASPFELGLYDGNERVDRVFEEISMGSLTREEAIEYLQGESKRIKGLIQYKP
jgi:hypothetical protein